MFPSMTDFSTLSDVLPHIPDDLTVAQFMLDYQHELQPFRSPDIPCFIEQTSGRRICLQELQQRTYGLANTLKAKFNIGRSDTVMIVSPNHADYLVVLWAVHRLGGIVSCTNPMSTAEELLHQIKIARVTFIVTHSSASEIVHLAATMANLPDHRVVLLDQPISSSAMDNVAGLIQHGLKSKPRFMETVLGAGEGRTRIALLSWSSGTTGNPKAVAISHYAFIANIIQMAVHNRVKRTYSYSMSHPFRPGDVSLGVLPLFHVAGLVISVHLMLFAGLSVVIIPKYAFRDMLDTIVRYRISHLILVPPQAVAMCKDPSLQRLDLSFVKYILVGAAPLSKEVQERLFDLFPTAQIGQAYGLSETTSSLSMIAGDQKRGPPGSGGRLLPGIEARVLKADGTIAVSGESGELVVRGPSASLGYLDNRQANRETFVNGWVHTGDEVILTSNQEIYVLDRIKELIKVRGFQVAPAELEGCILGHPDVSETCVVGVQHDYNGEVPLAFVVLTADARRRCMSDVAIEAIAQSIVRHVSRHKIGYKHLKGGVIFVDSIPKSSSGKLLRRLLRDKIQMTEKTGLGAKL